MPYSHHERLTAIDSLFLDLEKHEALMRVGAVALFDPAPLEDERGRVDFERIRVFTEVALPTSSRFRQMIRSVPLFGQPIWVDDASFSLGYHLRHAALPRNGPIANASGAT